MRHIVNDNRSLNIALNEIVNNEMDKTIDEMITVIESWKNNEMTVSCDTIIYLLQINKSEYSNR